MNYKAICLISICTAAFNVNASDIEVCGELKQGELAILKNIPAEVETFSIGERIYPITEDGYAIVAFHRDEKNNLKLSANLADGSKQEYSLNIDPAKWDIQRINGVPQQKVTPDSSHDEEILREQKEVRQALQNMKQGDFWRQGFIIPVEGRISGNFGNQRIFNGTPKNPHTGTDIAAPEGTPVKAAADGIIILNGHNYFYSGNTVIIDHGQGLQTIYAHLKKANVQQGDIVRQGDVIGFVGKTGRATGPHLHWGASLNNVRFRPHSLLDINNKTCQILKGK